MGWERRGSGLYYYRKHREGERTVSEYIGPGDLGILAAHLDNRRREELEAKREAERKARTEHEALDATIDELGTITKALVTATLEEAGYHRHKRQWRRTRAQNKQQ